ncbi:MAG: serpin family protein [Candidatus Brocadiia bacterium]|nr:serpin family protein [Candidatus Brocadiia bacterium]
MKKSIRALVVLLVLVPLTVDWAGEPSSSAISPDTQALVSGNNAFAFDLYAKLREQRGNLFLSHFSIYETLAMVYAGARGNTEAQMAKTLHNELGRTQLHPTFEDLLADVHEGAEQGGYELRIASAIWGQKGYRFRQEYLDLTRAHYGAGPRQVDFVNDPGGASKAINAWVKEETRGKIEDIIHRDMLTVVTRLVLTNAIYFKGEWASRFEKKRTEDGPFTLLGGDEVHVPMMHQTGHFGYFEEEGLKGLVLPYVGRKLGMVVLLPDKAEGLARLEESLTAEKLSSWLDQARYYEVTVTLPKWKTTTGFRLEPALRSVGMTDAFVEGRADFSGMNGRKDLFVQTAVHQAYVDVNEKGTEAAAATGFGIGCGAKAPEPPKAVFRADHPFVFIIGDLHSRLILFVGRIADPR